MTQLSLVESVATSVKMTSDQASALRGLGTKLASKKEWWGSDDVSRDRTIIDVYREAGDDWTVVVREAVGVISVDGLEFVVRPKINTNHFLYLAQESMLIPRTESSPTRVSPDQSLWEVYAYWMIAAAEAVLHGELAKGYRDTTDTLALCRGRVLPLETARAFYQGQPVVACEFDEFSEDIPINRLMKAACELVASSSALDREIRHRARSAMSRMTDVGKLQQSDLRTQADRLTHRYRHAVAFAKVLIRGGGTRFALGTTHGWCFLIRTPDLMESGIRAVIRRHLGHRWQIDKVGRAISGTSMYLNPDLVVNDGLAVGDVKYKILISEWSRADLYQSVAFAAGYHATQCIVVGFQDTAAAANPPRVQVGEIQVDVLAWDASLASNPAQAGESLAQQFATIVERVGARSRGSVLAAS